MTERSTGVPDRAGAEPAPAPLADPAAVRRTDALVEALAGRRVRAAALPDPALRLLGALVADVDDPTLRGVPGLRGVPAPEDPDERPPAGPEEPAGTDPARPGGAEPGPRRRGHRTIVALGVAGAVLAGTGVAAAGSGTAGAPAPPRAAEAGPRELPGPAGPSSSRARLRRVPPPDQTPPQAPAARPPVAGDERPDRAARPRPDAPVREDLEDLEGRVKDMPPGRPPARNGRSGWRPEQQVDRPQPAGQRERAEEVQRRLEEIRRRAERRLDRYRR
ncbi:hypothetical protein GCM10009678_39930 [Actinomadura kijaniata]|uniref:Uncharacterized protein n=1 Tax=Actinomadura namibiensis TaxID=182080 RepID=A0A7W3QPA8_ACTNM|nr:hypothetical protein [Actinomadura namibiensis]MBA8954449.1 hypothetical protein [Actinomadura namibiensis]